MIIALRLALFLVASLALLSYLGYTPARLLVKERAARLLLLPPLGLCVLVIAASFLNYLLPMPGVLAVTLAAATAANVWTVRRFGLGLALPGRAGLAAVGLGVLAYVIAGAPQVHADTLAFLGVQWDLEIYLPLSEYLKRFAMGGELSTYPSPLLATMNDPAVRGGSGWGFMYVDAALGTVLNWPSWESFRPTLHLLFGLSAPAVFSLCRQGFRMGPGASLVAAALTALNGLNLWVASIGLGGHAVAFVLLPLSTLGVLWLVHERSREAAVLTGIFVAGLLMSFYTGAAAVLAAVLIPIGLHALATHRQRMRMLALALGSVGVLAVLGIVAHVRFLTLLPLYFRDGLSEGWKVSEFLSLSQSVGLTPYVLIQQRLTDAPFLPDLPTEAVAAWGTLLSVAVVTLCGLGLIRGGWARTPWLAGLLGLAVFAAFLRFGSAYPYGYFKVFSLGYFILAAGIGQGLATLVTTGWLPQRLPHLRGALRLPSGALATLVALAAVPLLAANLQQSLRYFWEPDPNELPSAVWELDALHDHVAAGAPVYVTGRSGFDPRFAAMVSYFLMDNPIIGNLKSAYGSVLSDRPDERFEYLLFQRAERPEESGVPASDLVWSNDLVALYRRPQAWVTAVDLESVQASVPLSAVPVELSLRSDGWSLENGHPLFDGAFIAPVARQQVEMTLLALQPTSALVTTGGSGQAIDLPAGLVQYRSAPVATPTTLSVSLPAGTPGVRLLGLRIMQASEGGPTLLPSSDLLVMQATPEVTSQGASLALDVYVNSSRQGHTAASVEFYRRDRSGLEPAGFTQLLLAKQPQHAGLLWNGDLTDASCGDDGPPQPRPDGEYEAHVAMYYVNEEVYRQRWLRFTMRDGRVTNTALDSLPPYQVQYLSPPKEVLALARAIPVGASVYLPVAKEVDHSFIATAAATLVDQRFMSDVRGEALPRYALAPSTLSLTDVGLGDATVLWEGQSASLYKLPDSLAAYVPFATPVALSAAASLSVTIQNSVLRLNHPSATAQQRVAQRPSQAQLVVRGIASTAGELRIEGSSIGDRVSLDPGAFTYRTTAFGSAGVTAIMTATASDGSPVLVQSVALEAALDGPVSSQVEQKRSSLVTASTARNGNAATVAVDYVGPTSNGTVLGIDIYETASCDPVHYGWWAAPLTQTGISPRFEVQPEAQRVVLLGDSPATLASQAWPASDGTYRGFVMIKQGETFDTLPAFEFTLSGGELTAFESFPGSRMVPVLP